LNCMRVMRLALLLAALGLAGCAGLVGPSGGPGVPGGLGAAGPSDPLGASQAQVLAVAPTPTRTQATLTLDAVEYRAEWVLPTGPALGLVTLQHGFSRSCRHLRGTASALAKAGLMVLCLDASMTGGNAVLARRLAQALAEGEIAPPGRAMPERVVVSGHSAGAHFAVVLGAELARRAPQRVAGAVLLDPVAGRGFEEALQALSQTGLRPVLSVAAREHPCNARHNAHPALRRLREATVAAGRDGLAGVVQGEGSTHMDAEGEDTDLIAWAACGRQWPDPAHVATLRALLVHWAGDLAAARTPAEAGPLAGPLPDALQGGRLQLLR